MSSTMKMSAAVVTAVAALTFAAGCGEDTVKPNPQVDDPYHISLSRRYWYQASPPVDPGGTGETLSPDSALSGIWYNIEPDKGGVHRRDLDPSIEEKYNTLVPSLDIELLGAAGAGSWIGIMAGVGSGHCQCGNGLDLSGRTHLEIYINDFKPDPQDRGGRVFIELGVIDEDFFEPEKDEANDEDQEGDGWQAVWDDTGLDGMFNINSDAVQNNPDIVRVEENPGGADPDLDPHGDDYTPSRIDGRFSKVNGTEKNNVYDTEDLDRSGNVEQTNAYYRYEIDLASDPVRDVRAEYPDYEGFSDPFHENDAWRWYRVELSGGAPVSPGGGAPDLSQVRHIRIWFEDVAAVVQNEDEPGRGRIQFAELGFENRSATTN
jgi:hypothetical protein